MSTKLRIKVRADVGRLGLSKMVAGMLSAEASWVMEGEVIIGEDDFLWEGMKAAHELGTEGGEDGWCALSMTMGKQYRYIMQGENDCSQHLLWAPQKLGTFRQQLAAFFPQLDAVEEGCFSHSTKTDATGCWFHPWSSTWLKKVTEAFGSGYFKVLQDKDN